MYYFPPPLQVELGASKISFNTLYLKNVNFWRPHDSTPGGR